VSGYGELNTLPVEVIDRILDVDLRGQVYGVKAVLPILREQRHGTIIGVSSGVGVRAVPLMIPYCIAKSGVNALYEGLRLEKRHAKSNVRVTTILPGVCGCEVVRPVAGRDGGQRGAVDLADVEQQRTSTRPRLRSGCRPARQRRGAPPPRPPCSWPEPLPRHGGSAQ